MATPLNSREAKILALLAKGTSVRDIADALSTTERTTRAHMQMIVDRLGVADSAEAIAVALREGIVGR